MGPHSPINIASPVRFESTTFGSVDGREGQPESVDVVVDASSITVTAGKEPPTTGRCPLLMPLAQMAEELVSLLDRAAIGAALDRARRLAEALEVLVHEGDRKAVQLAEGRAPEGLEQ